MPEFRHVSPEYPHVFVISISVDEDEKITVDFSGFSYWAFRGVLEAVTKFVQKNSPPIEIQNIIEVEEEIAESEDEENE